jgi:hypothetical protein
MKLALIIATVVGMGICTAGIGPVAKANAWLSFNGIAGTLLGIAALLVVGSALIGRPLPLIADERAALIALGAIVVVKIGVAAAHPLA